MQHLLKNLQTPAENLALDEALLDQAEENPRQEEILRLWEPPGPMVVLGRSSRIAGEVIEHRCNQLQIPILRRSSGGASILAGPGCLMYGVVLSCKARPQLRAIDAAHHFVLSRLAAALSPLVPGITRQGTSDLAMGDRKFSGNSLRVKRHHLLYHGTLLYNLRLDLVSQCLRTPPRTPAYRQGRQHDAFLVNLPLSPQILRTALIDAFDAQQSTDEWPADRVDQLVQERYGQTSWTRSF